MAAAVHNFFIEQGSDFEIIFEYFDENGLPITINSDWCIRLKLKDSNNTYYTWKDGIASNNSSLLTRDNDASLSTNQIKWYLPASVTREYSFDTASYALDMVTDPNEQEIIKLAVGQIGLIKDLFLTECLQNDSLITCKNCLTISANDAVGQVDPLQTPTPTPTPQNVVVDPTITPTPTPTRGGSGGGVTPIEDNLCDYLCRGLDIFSELYSGTGVIPIQDAVVSNSYSIPQLSSSIISIANTGVAVNIEVYIDSLSHQNPSDLTLYLTPPSGDSVLLSHRQKIKDYNPVTGLSFAYSTKALPGMYLYNKFNNNDLYVNILNSSGTLPPSPYIGPYAYSFDHLINNRVTGDWTLNVLDNDPGGTGTIKNWNLIVTYEPIEYIEGV